MSAKNNLPFKPQIAPKPGKVKVVQAKYSYTAKYADELSFNEGDILFVFDRSNSEWWKASCGLKRGLIPSNYVGVKLVEILDPLHEAARRGNISFLSDCVNQNVSSTSLDSMGNTPLYWAAHSGHLDCLLLLLNQLNPPVNEKNHFGDTPLHGASAKGHYDIVKTLLKAGADPTATNNNGETSEMLAMNISIKNLLQSHKKRQTSALVGVSPEEYEDDSD